MTPDNAGQTTSELLEELVAKARPACAHCQGETTARFDDSASYEEHKRICWPARQAREAHAILAVDHLAPVVEALEEALTYRWSRYASGRHVSRARQDARAALADLHAALETALKEAQDA
jgi:hypothetical protein